MARELFAQFPTGSTLYAVLLDASGQPWKTSAFDATPTAGEWANYVIDMTEDSTLGHYVGTMPTASAGLLSYHVHKQIAGSPATTDPVVWVGEGAWDGTAWVSVTSIAANAITAASIAADAITDSEISTAAAQKIADVIFRRTMASIEASANGETLSVESLYGLIAAAFEASLASTTLTVRKSDGSTLGTKTLTTDAAAVPVTGIT